MGERHREISIDLNITGRYTPSTRNFCQNPHDVRSRSSCEQSLMSQGSSKISSRSPQGPNPSFTSDPLGRVQQEESLRDILRVWRKRKYFILSFALGALALGLLVCFMMRPQYTSTATLLVDKDTSSGLDLGSLGGMASALGGSDDIKSEIQTNAAVLQTDTILLKVVSELNLQNVAPYQYKFKPGWFGGDARFRAEQGLPLEKAPATRQRILGLISKRLTVVPKQDTRLIEVTYRDYDPERAAAIANSVVNTYIHAYLEMHYQSTARASDWLSGQLGTLKENVDESQRKLADYERKTGLTVLMLGMSMETNGASGSSGGGSASGAGGGVHIPAVDKLTALNAELTSAEANRIAKEAIYHLTQTQSPEVVLGLGSSDLSSMGGGSAVISQGNGLAVLQALREQEAAIKVNYGDISTKYGAKNPRLAELQGQMAALNEQIHQELLRINQRAQNDLTLAQKAEGAIREEYTKQEDVVNKLNDSMVQLEILAGEAISSRVLYEELQTKLQEAGVTAGVKATNLDLVDPARPPARQARPDWLIYPAIACGAGLLLGIAGAFIIENLDDAVVTSEQVQQISGYPVLAAIPLIRAGDIAPPTSSGEYQESSLLVSQPRAPAAESYRVLRTAIQLSAIDSPLQALIVCSPVPGDGKSMICYNLAIAFAQQGKRVLIVDADMRKSKMHLLFRTQKSPGLSEVLAGRVSFETAVRPHSLVENLWLLPAGITPPNPAELVGSSRWDDLLTLLRGRYDLILIDSPPILLVTDAVILSSKVDGTIMVIRSGSTARTVLARISEWMDRSTGRQLGFVLNAVDTRSVEYYYAYGYYGDSKYYGEEDAKS
jgi:succinoglycan biosynthesis transport protein ExoP